MGLLEFLNIDPARWTLQDVNQLILNATNMALNVAGIVAAIYIVIGAFQYLTAYGDEQKSESAKKTLLWAIIGLSFIIISRVISGEILLFLTG